MLALDLKPGLHDFSHRVERAILSAIKAGHMHRLGLVNFGQTCYMNVVVQCLYNTTPIRNQIEDSPMTGTLIHKKLCSLFRVSSNPSSSWSQLLRSLVDFIVAVFEHKPTFAPGETADATECLLCVLQDINVQNLECVFYNAKRSGPTCSTTQPLSMKEVFQEVFCISNKK